MPLPTCQNYIGGAWLPADSSAPATTPVFNPSTGETIAACPVGSVDDAEAAIAAAHAAFPAWRDTPPVDRARVFFRYRHLVEQNFERLTALISREHGKTAVEAKGDLHRGLENIEYACGIPTLLMGDTLENIARGVDCETLNQPLGVCVGITPFNFPAMVPLWMYPLALACGNTFVLKPSAKVPLTAIALVELLAEAGLPKGVLSLVHGGKAVMDTLLTHPSVKAISFVGSTPIARYIHDTATRHGKRCQANRGAKNYIVVMPDADMGKTIENLATAAFGCAGVSSFKIFLAYKGAFGIDDPELYATLKLAKELGVIVTAHCENETLVFERQKELLAAGKTDPAQHHESRPPLVEAEGVHHLMTFAELTGASVYIVHLSCEQALKKAVEARLRGVDVSVETLIQYLLIDKTHAERPDFEGAKYVMSPPLRDAANQPVLWNALRTGLIQTVATDHAPFDFRTQKPMGAADFTKIPNGIPALEERINLLYTYGVKTGTLDLHTFVNVASTQAAKLFGLFPKKGAIQPGSDADLVIYDPAYRGQISAATQVMNVDYSGFEGWPIEGRPSVVTVRGQVAVRDGKFVGTVGRGRFLARTPNHF